MMIEDFWKKSTRLEWIESACHLLNIFRPHGDNEKLSMILLSNFRHVECKPLTWNFSIMIFHSHELSTSNLLGKFTFWFMAVSAEGAVKMLCHTILQFSWEWNCFLSFFVTQASELLEKRDEKLAVTEKKIYSKNFLSFDQFWHFLINLPTIIQLWT